jgi:hypothetical protein
MRPGGHWALVNAQCRQNCHFWNRFLSATAPRAVSADISAQNAVEWRAVARAPETSYNDKPSARSTKPSKSASAFANVEASIAVRASIHPAAICSIARVTICSRIACPPANAKACVGDVRPAHFPRFVAPTDRLSH